jgi:uncharacterized protein YaaR (DUF327 family)
MNLVNNQGFHNPQPATGADLFSADRHPLLEREAVRQIGIHGARGTGKTCYLASLYGRRINYDLGFSLSLDDNNPEDSLDHLRHAWQALQKGSVPPATAAVNPFRLSFTVTHCGQSWSVRTLDYAGVLVERTPTGAQDLKMEVQQWLCQCDGLLIFVDLSEQPQNLLDRLNEVDLLLNRLRKLSPDGQTVPIPVAVVFTKWDCVAKDLQGADFASQQKKLRHYLATHAEFKQFYDQIQLSSDRVEVFPVSVFGKYQGNNLPPPQGAQPFGIHEPILWVLQQCDQAIFDATEARVTPLLNKRWANYAKAIATYNSIARKRLIVRGPVADSFAQAIRQLRVRAAFRFTRLAASILFTSVLLTLSGMLGWDTYRYHAALRALNDVRYVPEKKEQAALDYIKTANPFAQWLGRRQRVEEHLAMLRKDWHDDDYNELLSFWTAHEADETKQQEIVTRTKQFLNRWPDSPYRSEVETWQRNADAVVRKQHEQKAWEGLVQFFTQHDKDSEAEQRINRIEAFLREYPESDYKEDALSLKRTAEDAHKRWQQFQTLLSEWPQIKQECETLTIGGNSDAAVKKCVEFRTKCQQFQRSVWSSPTDKEYGDELARLLDEIDKTGDQCQWRGVELYTARNPSNYDEIIKRAKAYKDSTTFATKYFEKAADKLMIQTLRSEWSQIQVECENLTNGGNSDAAVDKCKGFLTKCQKFQQSVWSSPNDKEYSDELAQLLDEIDKTGDQYQWRGVELYAARNRSHYEQIIEKAEAYKNRKPFATKSYDKAADSLIEKTAESWDSALYNGFRNAAIYAADLAVETNDMERKTRAFEDAAKLARAYLESKCPKKKHKSTVEKWLKWFDGINKPAVALTVVIVQAQLADNAETIYDPFDPPDVEITLELSTQAGQNQRWKTPVVNNSYTPRYNVECRNVMVSWNDRNAKLTLTLTDKDTAFDDVLPITFQGPDVIFLLDGWVWVQDGPGRHHIRFSCEQLQPPTLPEYGNNPL